MPKWRPAGQPAARPILTLWTDGRATAARGATFVAAAAGAACARPGGRKLVRLLLLRSVVGFLSSMCLRLCVARVCLSVCLSVYLSVCLSVSSLLLVDNTVERTLNSAAWEGLVRLFRCVTLYSSVSQPLWDRGRVKSFFIRRGPGPNKFTRKCLSNFFFKFIH